MKRTPNNIKIQLPLSACFLEGWAWIIKLRIRRKKCKMKFDWENYFKCIGNNKGVSFKIESTPFWLPDKPLCCQGKLFMFRIVFIFRFSKSLEEACIETIESGKMTKDLAACIHGLANVKEGTHYQNTDDFLGYIQERLAAKLKK